MQQLSGMDASFLYFESASAPAAIGSFAIYSARCGSRTRSRRFSFMVVAVAGARACPTSRRRSRHGYTQTTNPRLIVGKAMLRSAPRRLAAARFLFRRTGRTALPLAVALWLSLGSALSVPAQCVSLTTAGAAVTEKL